MSGQPKASLTPTTSLLNKAQQQLSQKDSNDDITSSVDSVTKGNSNSANARQINTNNRSVELNATIVNVTSPANDKFASSERATDFYSSNKESLNDNSWKLTTTNKNTILRDCSDPTIDSNAIVRQPATNELKASDSRLNISIAPANAGLINLGDNNKHYLKSSPATLPVQSANSFTGNFNRQPVETRARFQSLLDPDSDQTDTNKRELNSIGLKNLAPTGASDLNLCDSIISGEEAKRSENNRKARQESKILLSESPNNESHSEEINFDEDDEDSLSEVNEEQNDKRYRDDYLSDRSKSPSYFKRFQRSFSRRLFDRLNTSLVGRSFLSNSSDLDSRSTSEQPYAKYEDKDLLTGSSKYNIKKRAQKLSAGRTFRGTYKYSRAKITMAIFKKIAGMIVQRSTLSLLGAFLIHVTLGTVYTLSNINSYLTSYMRLHGSPNATYGGSMWISSSYAVGQGFSMVLGGYIEKRFSARVACIIGCALHSISIMSTSWSIDHGPLAVLMTYGFLPGFGCGLAYMTPMSNGFGWFPNRKGLVAGTILAGFGIGTFVFNVTQTAYVNPENLSPPEDANGYFTQTSILDKVPHLFVFIGTIYASMQFVGCCLLFKPPNANTSGKSLDERPILVETEMPLKRSIQRREFIVLFVVYGITTQGILFVNSMLKEYGQLFIGNDMYLAWTGSMASVANSLGRLSWGLAIDRFSFTQCFTAITIIFGSLMFIMPFEFVLSSKLLYLLCTLGLFGSFSGWMSTYPVHLSRVFGRTNSGMIYGLIFISQSLGGIVTALGAHYLIDHFSRFVPFFCVVFLEILGLAIYHLFYPK